MVGYGCTAFARVATVWAEHREAQRQTIHCWASLRSAPTYSWLSVNLRSAVGPRCGDFLRAFRCLRGYIARMYTTCPECKQLFRLHADHLRVAGGKVRCGDCGTVFVALQRVYATPEDAQENSGAASSPEIDALVDKALEEMPEDARPESMVSAQSLAADFDFFANPAACEFPAHMQVVEAEDFPPLPEAPERSTAAGVSRGTWWAIAATVLLTVLLFGQYTYVERDRLARNPELRPLLEQFCGWLNCDLPLYRDPQSLAMVERDIRARSGADGALLISAVFVNQADFEQPWPVLRVSFSDVSGTIIAARNFQPQEYLPGGRVPLRALRAGERVQATLEIVDPGERAESYQFDFF